MQIGLIEQIHHWLVDLDSHSQSPELDRQLVKDAKILFEAVVNGMND